MYIEKIKINKFRVLEDIEVRFQVPGGESADPETGNVVNVVAGVNGTGKTSLLEAIYQGIYSGNSFENKGKHGSVLLGGIEGEGKSNWLRNYNYFEKIKNIFLEKKEFSDAPRLVFIPSQFSFQYTPTQQISLSYSVCQKLDGLRVLGNAEFYIKEYVLAEERGSKNPDPKKRTKSAVDKFNRLFLDANLLTKLVDLDAMQFNRPVFCNSADELVTIDQLSDGEKQLYGRAIALMIIRPQNSVVLIDEPEIALHPAWQQKIMQIYSRIGTNNQFIVATHSPQVIASVPYQNRIILRKEDGKIKTVHCHQPPSGVDVNSILAEVMGAEPRPTEVLQRYQRYRQLVEQKQENSEEAQELRELLVKDEGEHSRFMQEMAFFIELRDAA